MTAYGGCAITGSASMVYTEGGQLEWQDADPAIHITTELLDLLDEPGNERGRDLLLATYKVGDLCPYRPDSRHARRTS